MRKLLVGVGILIGTVVTWSSPAGASGGFAFPPQTLKLSGPVLVGTVTFSPGDPVRPPTSESPLIRAHLSLIPPDPIIPPNPITFLLPTNPIIAGSFSFGNGSET